MSNLNKIKKLRLLVGLTQSELAEITGEQRSHISRWETNKTEITLVRFLSWCKAVKFTDFNELFDDD